MIRTCLIFLLLAVSGVTAAAPENRSGNKPVVYASNYPLYFFAVEIAGGEVDIRMPEMDGDPAYWAPDGDQVAELQAADRILLNGAGYESWLDFVSLREERLVDTTAGLAERLLPLEEATVHQHGPKGEHSHAGTAFTTWLDPQLAAAQAQVIADVLSALSPSREDGFRQRSAQLEKQLQQLDRDLENAFQPLGNRPVVFSHPVYQYLQARYGINGRSVHWEPEVEPSTKDWIEFQKMRMDHPNGLMFWEGEPLAEVRAELRQQGIATLVFETAGNRPAQGDYFGVMEHNLRRLLEALDQE